MLYRTYNHSPSAHAYGSYTPPPLMLKIVRGPFYKAPFEFCSVLMGKREKGFLESEQGSLEVCIIWSFFFFFFFFSFIIWHYHKTSVVIVVQGPVVQSTISAYSGLPVNLLFWFRLFWLNNPVQISQHKTFLYTPEICKRKYQLS